MDTKAVAEILRTESRILRRFIRDKKSTFQAVGSGSRYDFPESDLPELKRRFAEWAGNRQLARPQTTTTNKTPVDPEKVQRERDEAVWAEEGPVVMKDIRDPRVLAQVRAVARAQERRLNDRLLAAGRHISQLVHATVDDSCRAA